MAIYKRPLSPSEVLKNYKAGRFYRQGEDDLRLVENGLIALYLFNEYGGSVIHDKSGYGLDMDLFIPDNVIIDEQKHQMHIS